MAADKVSPGQKVTKPSASLRNTSIDVAEHWKRRGPWQPNTPTHTQRNYSKVKIQNSTGADLRRGEVVEFDEFLLTDIEQDYLWFDGVEPDLTHVGWGITLQPIKEDEIDQCLVLGVCIAHVDITSEDHEYATRVDGSTVLESASIGPVKILHKPTGGTPPEERECVVQIMDEGVTEKIVTPKTYLYAAFGGGGSGTNPNLDYGNVESNALAISTGNYIPMSAGSTATPRNRIVYPGLCCVWEFDSNGVLQKTDEEIYCVNLTGLPIMKDTWCITRQVKSSQYPAVTKIGEFARAGKMFTFGPTVTTTVAGNEAKILRGDATAHESPENTSYNLQDFAHADDTTGDVFIHHPGTYTLTIGGAMSRANSATSDTSEWTDDDGDVVDLPNPVGGWVGLILNHNPAGSALDNFNEGYAVSLCVPAQFGGQVMAERTVKITHTLDNWHGQPYLRLSCACKVDEYEGSAGDAQVGFIGWVYIRPEGGGQEGGNEGTGYNAFLGSSGSFQWWGGGDPPVDFDEDGAEV